VTFIDKGNEKCLEYNTCPYHAYTETILKMGKEVIFKIERCVLTPSAGGRRQEGQRGIDSVYYLRV